MRILQEGCGPESSIIKTLVNSGIQENPPAPETSSVSETKVLKQEKSIDSYSQPKGRYGKEKERRRSRSPNRRRSSERKHSDDRNKFHDQERSNYHDKNNEKERSHRRERSRDKDRDRRRDRK